MLEAAAEAGEGAAVAFVGAGVGQALPGGESLAFFGGLGAGLLAGFGFAVESLRNGRGASCFAEREDFHLKDAAVVGDGERVSDVEIAGGLHGLAVAEDAAELAGARGESAGLEEARGPEPFVETDAGHEDIVARGQRMRAFCGGSVH